MGIKGLNGGGAVRPGFFQVGSSTVMTFSSV